jgi:hypothetical protein
MEPRILAPGNSHTFRVAILNFFTREKDGSSVTQSPITVVDSVLFFNYLFFFF